MMKNQKPAVKSVANAFTALEFIVEKTLEKEGATLAEVAERLSMQKTTARNLLQTLELCGYVRRCGFGFYRLGDQCRRLFTASETVNKLRTASLPVMREFCRKNHASVQLSVFFNGRRHTSLLLDLDGREQESSSFVDTPENAFRRASTRLLLACSSPEEREQFFEQFGKPSEDSWREGALDLDSALEKIREQGYAVNENNRVTRLIGIAFGIFDAESHLCGALSTQLLEKDATACTKKKLISYLRQSAEKLTDIFAKEKLI